MLRVRVLECVLSENARTDADTSRAGYSYGDSDKIWDMGANQSVSFDADEINANGSIFCHMLPLTEDTGSADTCTLLGKWPGFISGSNNIMNDR